MRNFLIGLILFIAGIGALMFIPSKQAPAPMPWDVTIMADGNSKVFGIHLGTTTYHQAQESFHEYGKTAIFTERDKASSVEAFFNSIHLGGLSAKVVLNLTVPELTINRMLSRAAEARLQPSGAHRYELNNIDNAELINATINAITYIPSIRLNPDMIRYRFSEPDFIEQDTNIEGTEIWHYSTIALTIRINDKEKTILQYQSR
jgi:hypothetical protein